MSEQVTLTCEVEVVEIPGGGRCVLPAGMAVRVSQALGDSYTIEAGYGSLYRVDGKDADALGLEPVECGAAQQRELNEAAVWDVLQTIYNPEIPVNIADMGLIYGCTITPL